MIHHSHYVPSESISVGILRIFAKVKPEITTKSLQILGSGSSKRASSEINIHLLKRLLLARMILSIYETYIRGT